MERGAAAVQPTPAARSAPHEPPRPQPHSQHIENSRSAATASTHTIDRVTRAQVTEKLRRVTISAQMAISAESKVWVAGRFAGDVAALAVAAKSGDAKAQLAMKLSCVNWLNNGDAINWMFRAPEQGNVDMQLFFGLESIMTYLHDEDVGPEREATKDTQGCASGRHGRPVRARRDVPPRYLLRPHPHALRPQVHQARF